MKSPRKVVPKKKVTNSSKPTEVKKPQTKKPNTATPKPTKKTNKLVNKGSNEYIKLSENSPKAMFNDMGQKVQSGEVIWAYYAVEDDIGYHFYLKLK